MGNIFSSRYLLFDACLQDDLNEVKNCIENNIDLDYVSKIGNIIQIQVK